MKEDCSASRTAHHVASLLLRLPAHSSRRHSLPDDMARTKKRPRSNPYRIRLGDGSTLIRNTREAADGSLEGYGNWFWQVYDPDRRPTRKKINLRTRDQAAAHGKAMGYFRDWRAGLFDPWIDPAKQEGVTIPQAAAKYLDWKLSTGKSPATVETDRGHINRFASSMPAGSLMKHISPKHIKAFLNTPKRVPQRKRKAGAPKPIPKPKSAATQERIRASLQHFFGWASGRGF